MKSKLISFVCTVLASVVLAQPSYASTQLVSASIMAKVERVHLCEERSGGWHVNGPTYFGGLGWLAATWAQFRAPTFPVSMADATPQQQAWAMAHFVGSVLHFWPDQVGCTGGY